MKRISLTALIAVLGIVAGTAYAQTISIGTSSVGSSNYALGNALGKVLTEHAGLKVRVVPYGGGQQVLPLINRNELEMAISSATDVIFAYRGSGGSFKEPNRDLRVIASVFPYYNSWFVRKDTPYQSLSDLKGKKISTGFTANSAQHTIYLAGLAAFGVKESDFDGVPAPHVVRGADDFIQGKVESSTFAIGAGKVTEADAMVGGIRWLSVPNTPESNKRVDEIQPGSYIAQIMPSKSLVGIVGPTNVIFLDYLIMAGVQMFDDTAYKIAKLLFEQQDKLVAVSDIYARYEKENLSLDHGGVPFHPGAIKFYREKGIWKDR
jgi:TRAP transporter TAXI family solute receptor